MTDGGNMNAQVGASAWDYLVVTASNDLQARAYEQQLALRFKAGSLPGFRRYRVVPDLDGRRIGSGGSTLLCLMQVLAAEGVSLPPGAAGLRAAESELRKLRILIVHAGGDSRRLPAYGPCGKVFIPVPGEGPPAFGMTLFDRLLPVFRDLPAGLPETGQVVVTSGDALLLFDARSVSLARPGITALGCPADLDHSSKHGVFCADADGRVSRYLQKPSPARQHEAGAVGPDGQSILDMGVMSFDTGSVMNVFAAFGVGVQGEGWLGWPESQRAFIKDKGLDLYREIGCALGRRTTLDDYLQACRESGSPWTAGELAPCFERLHAVPFHLQTVPACEFLHFGTTRQLITSGLALAGGNTRPSRFPEVLFLNSACGSAGEMTAKAASWVEGCRVEAGLELGGSNVLVGVDITEPLSVPPEVCLEVVEGRDRRGMAVHFIRVYGIRDTFKDPAGKGGTFCNRPLSDWLAAAGLSGDDVWDRNLTESRRTLWDARVFPAVPAAAVGSWVWLSDPDRATAAQKQQFRTADRYSATEVAVLADQDAFYARRIRLRNSCPAC